MENLSGERVVFDLRDYSVERGIQFGHYNYTEVKPSLETHLHQDVLEICFCIKGMQCYAVEQNIFKLYGNDILIVPPNTPHSTGSYPEDKGELFWIQISTRKELGELCNLPNKQAEYLLESLVNKSNQVFKGAFQIKFLLEQLFQKLHHKKDTLSQLIINQSIIQILLQTLTLSLKKQQTKSCERIGAIDRFLLENLHRKIYLDELAKLIGTSTGYFKNWFKENTGIPPKEYINRSKIEQAKTDLFKKKSITNVAFDLGFSSSQYFSTTFKKFTGQTPKSFIDLGI